MKKLSFRVRESYDWQRFPKVLGIVPAVISVELGLSLLVGYVVARVLAGPRTHMQGRIPSLAFRIKQYKIHLHHWLVFSNVLLLAVVLHFSVVTPFVFYGFLGGIVAQGVFHYEDWHTIVQKVS